MTCCWEHAGAGLPAGLLSGPKDTAETSVRLDDMRVYAMTFNVYTEDSKYNMIVK